MKMPHKRQVTNSAHDFLGRFWSAFGVHPLGCLRDAIAHPDTLKGGHRTRTAPSPVAGTFASTMTPGGLLPFEPFCARGRARSGGISRMRLSGGVPPKRGCLAATD